MNSIKFRAMFRFVFLWTALAMMQASAGFSSIYVFGDGVCTTTGEPSTPELYYGDPGEKRYCNGKIWIEVLSQWQGLAYNKSNNKSYYGHTSAELINPAEETSVNQLSISAPEAATALFIVWSANADFVEFVYDLPDTLWTTRINQSIEDHKTAIDTLCDKGAKVIVMPNAVNIADIPVFVYDQSEFSGEIKTRVNEFNGKLKTAIKELLVDHPQLTIYQPDTYTFFEQVIDNPAAYGLINPPAGGNYENAAVSLPGASPSAGSPGSNYVFWDYWHPTAKLQMHLAAFFQQAISPVKVSPLSFSGGSGQLSVSNIPLGRAGVIQGSATLQPESWGPEAPINEPSPGGLMTKSYTVSATGPKRFYRAAFPVVWTWP